MRPMVAIQGEIYRTAEAERKKRMIEPTEKDIGRSVVYRPEFPPGVQGENGVISSF